MIRMIKGIYSHFVDGLNVDETVQTGPFSLASEDEAELVAKGCAEYVDTPTPAESANVGKKGKKKGGKVADGV